MTLPQYAIMKDLDLGGQIEVLRGHFITTSYYCRNTVTTSDGSADELRRIDPRTFKFLVKKKWITSRNWDDNVLRGRSRTQIWKISKDGKAEVAKRK